MRAMVLAAGVGSRLRPLTDKKPKALVEVGGVPLLEIVIRRLIRAGVDAAIVNVHHLPDQIEAFLKAKRSFGIRIELSREDVLLETGGGLKKAEPFLADTRPFFLHNADILTDLDLGALYKAHLKRSPLATLAVRRRETSRRFLFDQEGLLRGWESAADERVEWTGGPVAAAERLAFDGVHVISPAIFDKLTETGAFPLTPAYLRLAREGETFRAFRTDGSYWQTIGDPERLEQAEQHVRDNGLPS